MPESNEPLNIFPETTPLEAPTTYAPKKRIKIPFLKTILLFIILAIIMIGSILYLPDTRQYVPSQMYPILYMGMKFTPLPKTADYILFESTKSIPSIMTSDISTHIEIFDLDARGKTSLIVDGSGALDVQKILHPQMTQEFSGLIKRSNKSEDFSADIRLLDDTYYFKVSHPEKLPSYSQKEIWYSSTSIPIEVSTFVTQFTYSLSKPSELNNHIQAANIIGHERNRYILSITPTNDIPLINAKIVLWINDKNWYPEKITIEGQNIAQAILPNWLKQTMELKDETEVGMRIEASIKYINQPQRLVVPQNTNSY